jgi:hypothetical protein
MFPLGMKKPPGKAISEVALTSRRRVGRVPKLGQVIGRSIPRLAEVAVWCILSNSGIRLWPSDRPDFLVSFFMIYSAVGLAVMGVGAGLVFRWKVLLPIIVLLPLAAIVFLVSRGYSYKETAIVIVVAEGILQGGYFLGLLIRFVAVGSLRFGGALTRRDPKEGAASEPTRPSGG